MSYRRLRLLQLFWTLISCQYILYINGVTHLRNHEDQCEASDVDIEGGESRRLYHESTTHVFQESIAEGFSSRTDVVKGDRVESTALHEVIFHIQQRNEHKIKQILHEVSDPSHENYGRHLSKKDVEAITQNHASHDHVISYLKAANISILSETLSGEYVTAIAPIRIWEELLDTEFFEFYHSRGDEDVADRILRAESYSLPITLESHVASAFNTIQMPMKIWAKPIVVPVEDTSANSIRAHAATGFIDPSVYKMRYNIGGVQGNSQSTQLIYGTIGQYFSPADLTDFQRRFSQPLDAVDFDVGNHKSDSICISSPSSCVEANLDLQYIMATSQKSPTTYWYSNSNSFATFLVAVANLANPPLVMSISYGADESDVSRSELDAFNFQAMKLGVMGVTIMVASGGNGLQQ